MPLLSLAIGTTSALAASPQTTGPAPLGPTGVPKPVDLQEHLDREERQMLMTTLQDCGFNRTAAAAKLGLSLRQIRYRMARLHIEVPQADGSGATETFDESH
jgi:two-component system response regulator PilR (NtrC family)